MRDSQGDKVATTINEYMKIRNFQDSPDVKSEFSLLGNLAISSEEEAGIKGLISPSSLNCFTNTASSFPYQFIEQQYLRLKSWLTDAPEQYRTELSQFIFPFFVHLFIELLHGAGKDAAKLFFKRYHQIFIFREDSVQTLRQILHATNESTTSPIISNLKSGKHFSRISEKTLDYLLTFIQSNPNPTILQIFNNNFEIDITNEESATPHVVNSRRGEDLLDSQEASANVDCTAEELKQIKDIISNVQIIKPTMPSVCVYSVINAFNGLSCAQINYESTLLACGFEDSVIKLWRLTAAPQSFALDSSSVAAGSHGPETILSCDKSRVENPTLPSASVKEEDEDIKNIGGRHISGGEFCTLRGHKGPVFDVAYSHCSSYLFSVGEDATMKLWNLEEQRPVAFYKGHSYPVWCVDVSAQTLYVATGSYDQTVKLWSTEFTYPLRSLVGHTDSVDCVAFHPNCTYVGSGSSDRNVRLWQVNDGCVARILCHHSAPVKAVSFSPNGKYLASGSSSGEVVLWDLAEGKVLCHLGAQESSYNIHNTGEAVVSLGWSKDSRLVFAALSTGHIKGYSLDLQGENCDLSEVGNVLCSASSDLIHAKMNSHNYLASVMAVHGER